MRKYNNLIWECSLLIFDALCSLVFYLKLVYKYKLRLCKPGVLSIFFCFILTLLEGTKGPPKAFKEASPTCLLLNTLKSIILQLLLTSMCMSRFDCRVAINPGRCFLNVLPFLPLSPPLLHPSTKKRP